MDVITLAMARKAAANEAIRRFGSPLTAAQAADMTDVNRIYVYVGEEEGYTSGNWYYYNGTAWTSGGVYNAAAFVTDEALTVQGKAADAKRAGDCLRRTAGEVMCVYSNAGRLNTHYVGRTICADGRAVADNAWARSGTVSAARIPVLHVAENGVYRYRIAGYTGDTYDVSAFCGCMEGDFSGTYLFFPEEWKYVVFCIRRTDGENVSESDWAAASVCFEFMKGADDTLTQNGKAADAAAVGARTDEITAGLCGAKTFGAGTQFWETGSIASGGNVENSSKMRTVGYMPKDTVRIKAPEGYRFFCVAYDESGYVGKINEDGLISTDGATAKFPHRCFTPQERAYRFRIVAERADGGAVDADTVYGGVEFYVAPAQIQYRTTRNDPVNVSQFVAVARSYKDRSTLSYGYQTILDRSSPTDYIDCSALASLALRGYGYEDTSYHTRSFVAPETWVANPAYSWSINPYDWEVERHINGTEKNRIRLASQMAQWMVERGETVPMDEHLANLEPGDLLFYARKDPQTGDWVHPDRFMRVNHVAVCTSKEPATATDGWDIVKYPYKHKMIESARCENGVRERNVEAGPDDPADTYTTNNINTLVLICRPDLGSV